MADRFSLQRIPHTILIRGKDDWSGMSDRSSRRKIQNRLNQRTYRARRRQKQGAPDDTEPVHEATLDSSTTAASVPALVNAVLNYHVDLKRLLDHFQMLDPQSPHNQVIFRVFEMVASHDQRAGLVRPKKMLSIRATK
ncbi:hypothetical protein MY10362_009068 [Beauveria mimosiformis]